MELLYHHYYNQSVNHAHTHTHTHTHRRRTIKHTTKYSLYKQKHIFISACDIRQLHNMRKTCLEFRFIFSVHEGICA